MPSWKKVITSGSDASLNSLYAPHITGSLLGTASYAIYAETASLSTRTTQTDVLVLNQSGNNIAKGVVVRITGSNNASDIPRIVTASYENDNNSANTLGVTTQLIANGAEGYVVTEGVLTGVNTSAFTSGQLLYLGPTGSIIGTAPVAPLHSVRLGEVIREQTNNGSIYVRIDNGYEIGELHDVRDTTTSTSYGDLLIKSASVWTNSKQLSGSYGVTGSFSVQDSIDSSNKWLIGPGSIPGSTATAVAWSDRQLLNSSGATIVNWETGVFTGTATSASFAATASFINPLNQSMVITGSLRGQVSALSILSNTASVDMVTNNFFTLTLANGASTNINPTNINPGQTVNILVTQGSAGTGTVTFPSLVKQASGSLYTGSAVANAVDIVTMIAFDATNVYVSSIRNMI